jgi:cleavage stimulation factor subunit 3
MAYIWTSNVGKTDEALAIIKAGIEANPTSYLLNFAYAEAQEVRKDFAEVHAAYDRFLSALRNELATLERSLPAAVNANTNLNTTANTNGTTSANTANGDDANMSGTAIPPPPSAGSSQQSQSSNPQDEPPKSKELAERRSEYGLAYVMFMRFGRRAEGVKSSRTIFGKARKDSWTPWEVYEAAGVFLFLLQVA